MRTRALPPELDVDVDFCSVKDVVELEMMADVVELKREVLDPTGGLILPSNWVSTVAERTASVIMNTTKVNRFLAGIVMDFPFRLVHQSFDKRETGSAVSEGRPQLSATEKRRWTRDSVRLYTIPFTLQSAAQSSSST
jgi:hypothetical protein